jgi:hypothetical protein
MAEDETQYEDGDHTAWDPGSFFGLSFFLFVLAAAFFFFANVVALGGDANPRPVLQAVLSWSALGAFSLSAGALFVGLRRRSPSRNQSRR